MSNGDPKNSFYLIININYSHHFLIQQVENWVSFTSTYFLLEVIANVNNFENTNVLINNSGLSCFTYVLDNNVESQNLKTFKKL